MSAESDKLLAQAAEDYSQHNSPETKAESSQLLQDARAHAAESASSWGSNTNGGRS